MESVPCFQYHPSADHPSAFPPEIIERLKTSIPDECRKRGTANPIKYGTKRVA